jgi:hypothetical protein
MASSSNPEKSLEAIKGQTPLDVAYEKEAPAQQGLSASSLPPEFDHRGVRLPPRTRVGGIIIPQ